MLHYADVYYIAQSHSYSWGCPVVASYCAIPQTGLHCADVYCIAQSHGSSGGASLLLHDTVQFLKQDFITLMFITLHSIAVVLAALPYY